MIWNERYECMSQDQRKELQSTRLCDMVEYIYENVSFYTNKFNELGIKPSDVNSIDDLKNLPFTHKENLRDTYPFGLFAVPMSEIVRIHASSGTSGKQTVVGYTENDINLWKEVMARTISAGGGDKSSILQVGYGYGLFTGGLGAHYGGEHIGASVVPISGGNTKRQVQVMKDFGSTMLACTPSYALYLAEAIEQAGIKKDIKLKTGIFGAEPWTNEMRMQIEQRLGIKAFDIYGLSEIIGPGVSFECECQSGLHINEDFFLPEIIDPETQEVLPDGELGELVFTTITKEGMPLLRYRTRDITRLISKPCKCGRTTVRMEKPCGRSDDMLIIRGVNVFPSQIESVLLEFDSVDAHYEIIVDKQGSMDVMEIRVERGRTWKAQNAEKIEKAITSSLISTLGLHVKVTIVDPQTLPRSEGKAKRVTDNR